MQETEQWKSIPGFEGYYEASNLGRIRSLPRHVTRTNHSSMTLKGKVLKPQYRRNTGYYGVALAKGSKPKNHYIHRLVLMAFRGLPRPGEEACHKNDIRTDNRLENLRWDTHHANVQDAVKRDRFNPHGRGMTHCRRGHQFTKENTATWNGCRTCKECKRLMERSRYHKQKAAQGIPSTAYKACLT